MTMSDLVPCGQYLPKQSAKVDLNVVAGLGDITQVAMREMAAREQIVDVARMNVE